jgi:hypothetical protein
MLLLAYKAEIISATPISTRMMNGQGPSPSATLQFCLARLFHAAADRLVYRHIVTQASFHVF